MFIIDTYPKYIRLMSRPPNLLFKAKAPIIPPPAFFAMSAKTSSYMSYSQPCFDSGWEKGEKTTDDITMAERSTFHVCIAKYI